MALSRTYSVDQTLAPARLAELQAELHAAVTAAGGTVHVTADVVSRSRAAPR